MFGITGDFLEAKAAWLREERGLHQQSLEFFRLAGLLVSLSREHYELASLAFFQATIGLERALRRHFASDDEVFGVLFRRAVDEQIVTDAAFSEVRPLSDDLLKQLGKAVLRDTAMPEHRPLSHRQIRQPRDQVPTHIHALSMLVPMLRNKFVHGTHLLSPEYLHLTFQMREIADTLKTKRTSFTVG
jgi:hypothetical protein